MKFKVKLQDVVDSIHKKLNMKVQVYGEILNKTVIVDKEDLAQVSKRGEITVVEVSSGRVLRIPVESITLSPTSQQSSPPPIEHAPNETVFEAEERLETIITPSKSEAEALMKQKQYEEFKALRERERIIREAEHILISQRRALYETSRLVYDLPSVQQLKEQVKDLPLIKVSERLKEVESKLQEYRSLEPKVRQEIEYNAGLKRPYEREEYIEKALARAQRDYFASINAAIPYIEEIRNVYAEELRLRKNTFSPERHAFILKRMNELSLQSAKILKEVAKVDQTPPPEKKDARKLIQLENEVNRLSEEWVKLDRELSMIEEAPTSRPPFEHGFGIHPAMRKLMDNLKVIG